MKPISALRFLALFLIEALVTCSIRQHKLSEFYQKLEAKAPSPSSSRPPPHSYTKNDGRVFYPIGYGADPTGVEDSTDAILEALNDAFQLPSGFQLLPEVKDLGGVVLDFQGGNYRITKPINFPSGAGNVLVQGGTLRASETFPVDHHLIELWSSNFHTTSYIDYDGFTNVKLANQAIYYEDITFRDILFDSNYRGGGISVTNSARIRINNCFFLHFATEGILVQGGHETFISSCFLGQHSTTGGDRGERSFSGNAIDISSTDNAVTDVAIFSAAIGVIVRGQSNIISGVHCYNKATYFGGIGILVKASLTRINNCYLDYNTIVMDDPSQVHVTNGYFLGDGNVVLKSINGRISGLNIVDNMFNGDPKHMNPIVKLEGEFSSIDQVIIDRNNVHGMSLKSTVAKLTVAGNGNKWVADFSPVLLFPNRINHFQYSLYLKGVNGYPAHAVTNVSNNVVVVESSKAVNGVVSVVVDQYNIVGETNLLV